MNDKLTIFNIGSGESLSIKKLAHLIKKLVGFKSKILFDKNYPDGTLNKNLNSEKIKLLKWKPHIKLADGLMDIINKRG